MDFTLMVYGSNRASEQRDWNMLCDMRNASLPSFPILVDPGNQNNGTEKHREQPTDPEKWQSPHNAFAIWQDGRREQTSS